MVSASRQVANRVLVRVFDEGAYVDRVFTGEAESLDARDRAFAQRLAYGAIQRVRTLDHALEQIGGRAVADLDVPVRAALRLGVYELAFMDGVPPRATVNEAVELVRASGAGRATGLVNAVLRKAVGRIRELIESLPESAPQEAGLKHSYPDWIAEAWWREWGPEEALALMRAQNEPAETVERPAGTGVWRQSRGSQLAGRSVGVEPGERVLDLCAAPGGKTTQLAEAAAEVVAVELHPGRARRLEESVAELGFDNVTVVNADARELPPELTGFDRVLVDAPCSGLGVLASRPDLRWRAQPLPGLQLELLRVAAERVKPGGTITYSVCTIAAAENEDVVDALGLEVEPLDGEYSHPRRPEFILTLPHKHGTSGFFIARIHT